MHIVISIIFEQNIYILSEYCNVVQKIESFLFFIHVFNKIFIFSNKCSNSTTLWSGSSNTSFDHHQKQSLFSVLYKRFSQYYIHSDSCNRFKSPTILRCADRVEKDNAIFCFHAFKFFQYRKQNTSRLLQTTIVFLFPILQLVCTHEFHRFTFTESFSICLFYS